MKEWVQSLSGKKLFPRALTADQVGPIEDLAHSLAGEFRFTRQTRLRLSVAEHCVRGSRLMPAALAGAFLLHEPSEIFLPDIAGPLKPFVYVERGDGLGVRPDVSFTEIIRDDTEQIALGRRFSIDVGPNQSIEEAMRAYLGLISWAELEHQHATAVFESLGLSSLLPLIYSPEVKRMDLQMLATEKRDLCGPEPESWGLPHDAIEHYEIIVPWTSERAEMEFLTRFHELFDVGR